MSEHREGYKPTVGELQALNRDVLVAPRPISEPRTDNGVSLEAVRTQLQALKNRKAGQPEGRPAASATPQASPKLRHGRFRHSHVPGLLTS